ALRLRAQRQTQRLLPPLPSTQRLPARARRQPQWLVCPLSFRKIQTSPCRTGRSQASFFAPSLPLWSLFPIFTASIKSLFTGSTTKRMADEKGPNFLEEIVENDLRTGK